VVDLISSRREVKKMTEQKNRVLMVVIVNQGGYGGLSAERGDYDGLIDDIRFWFNKINQKESEKGPLAEVRVIRNISDITATHLMGYVDVLIFVTRGMMEKARDIQKEYPNIRVFVLSGVIDEVVVLDKMWVASQPEAILKTIILGS
jgi:basic membrane lipoprotein Med (substrate-binding protein (PBP1-ABC) superfamily)